MYGKQDRRYHVETKPRETDLFCWVNGLIPSHILNLHLDGLSLRYLPKLGGKFGKVDIYTVDEKQKMYANNATYFTHRHTPFVSINEVRGKKVYKTN